jgi:hypothetical protein
VIRSRDSGQAGDAVVLIAASFVVLFQELALIRWSGAQVRVLAYFPNVILISAFLGLGIGALLARRARSLLMAWPPLLLLAAGAAVAMSRIVFTQEAVSEHLWLLYYDLPKSAPVVAGVRLPLIVTFLVSAVSFVPLGQLIGRQLNAFRERGASLTGYAYDLLGSLLGVVAFAAASFARTPPWLWFTILFAVSAIFLRRPLPLVIGALCAAVTLGVVYAGDLADAWSPYYALRKIDLPSGDGFLILANGAQHQYPSPSRRADVVHTSEAALQRAAHHYPYTLLARPPASVLLLGAGSGNDAAVALDEGAQRIDAVEIDPVILDWGRFHPDRPYANAKVRTINNDARSVLNHGRGQYDLIVFGALDSMTRLSALSNVRLDNFVYTRECLETARRRLAPGGGLVLFFAVSSGYIDEHLRMLLTDVFGAPPAVAVFHNFRIYLAGPAFARVGPRAPQAVDAAVVPTDDWPYLYLRTRGVTSFYLQLIAAFGAIAVAATAFVALRGRARRFDGLMFFFGLAFLLVETKSVTEMNLVWGSTWLTSAVVFGSILAMVLGGTLLMRIKPLPWSAAAAALVAAMIVNYLTPVRAIVSTSAPLRLLLSLLFVGVPVFFASICFALRFREEEATDAAFGWNIVGAVVGGLLEFSSMAVGLKALTLLALGAYLAAFAVVRFDR